MDLFRRTTVSVAEGITPFLVLDGTSLAGSGNGGAVRPPDQVQVLERYGGFCQREKIPTTVLFVGKPLRELDQRGRYRGEISVVYADNRDQLPALLRKILKSSRKTEALVVTGSSEISAMAGSMGASVMSETTLRKVVERLSNGRGSVNQRSSRKRGGGGGNKKNNAAPKPEQSNGSKSEPDDSSAGGINDLIDLV